MLVCATRLWVTELIQTTATRQGESRGARCVVDGTEAEFKVTPDLGGSCGIYKLSTAVIAASTLASVERRTKILNCVFFMTLAINYTYITRCMFMVKCS